MALGRPDLVAIWLTLIDPRNRRGLSRAKVAWGRMRVLGHLSSPLFVMECSRTCSCGSDWTTTLIRIVRRHRSPSPISRSGNSGAASISRAGGRRPFRTPRVSLAVSFSKALAIAASSAGVNREAITSRIASTLV